MTAFTAINLVWVGDITYLRTRMGWVYLAVLLDVAESIGLDRAAAKEVLESGRYADEVRQAEAHFQQLGIHAVPSVIVNNRHLIQGGQPPEVFEQALRQIAGAAA